MRATPRQSRADPRGGGAWEGSALLSQLRPASQYEAKVLPENFFGLSQPEKTFNFATKGAGQCFREAFEIFFTRIDPSQTLEKMYVLKNVLFQFHTTSRQQPEPARSWGPS